jgi:hypothetical protein
MAEKLNLNKFKSSGVYTIEIDESGNIALPISTGRLVIGSSKKGPINSVVLLNSTRELAAVYGDKDFKLEKYGSYFQRTLEVALRQGPVYGLNVLPVTSNDKAAFATFNTEPGSANTVWNSTDNVDEIAHFYNTQKLWYADIDAVNKYKNIKLGDAFPATGGASAIDANKLLTVVNLSRKAITVWVKLANVSGYDLPVKEYYRLLGDKVQVPEALNPDEIIANLFVDVIAVEGDWTNYLALANDPIYSQYFTETGLIASKVDDFTAVREVTLVNRTQGCIIPEFRDLTGSIVSVDALFNKKFATTGLFCAIDYKKVDQIDLTSMSFDSGTTEAASDIRIDLVGHGLEDQGNEYGFDNTTTPVKKISVLSYEKPVSSSFLFTVDATAIAAAVNIPNAGEVFKSNDTNISLFAAEGSRLYDACVGGFIKSGDKTGANFLTVDSPQAGGASGNIRYVRLRSYTDAARTTPTPITFTSDQVAIAQATASSFSREFDLTDPVFFQSFSAPLPTKLIISLDIDLYGKAGETGNIENASGFNFDSVSRAIVDDFFKPGHFIKASVAVDGSGDPVQRPRYMRIKSVSSRKLGANGTPTGAAPYYLEYTVTVDPSYDVNNLGIELAGGNTITIMKGIKNFVTSIKGIKLPEMTFADENALYPSRTNETTIQDTIMDFVMEGSNLGSTLADNETVDFRYLVDSFQGDISSSSKSQLVQLAANHGKVLALCNAPSIAQLERSNDPSFIDSTTRLVSPEYISTGGNLDANPAFTFGFAAGDKNGIPISTYGAYFMPNIVIFEGGKNKSIPPAMYVANAFMRKYNSGNTFSIVAGRRGILTEGEITGLEYDFTNEDRDYLEPAGFNLIVRRRGFGVMIFSNNTGYQKVRSALNNIHVREALATIERDIERILLNFLFDFNDTATRMRVKTLVTNYLTAVQDARGIASAEVVFDDSNNPVEVLEANAGVIDVIVDFPRGIHKFINRITITRAGGQLSSNSSGFTPSF